MDDGSIPSSDFAITCKHAIFLFSFFIKTKYWVGLKPPYEFVTKPKKNIKGLQCFTVGLLQNFY